MTEEEYNKPTKEYKISAKYKKSTYQEERWVKTLSTGKNVTFLITTYFRWGDFTIELNDDDKEEILKKNHIILNDYNASIDAVWDGTSYDEEIVDKENYDSEELEEINDFLYNSRDGEVQNSHDEAVDIDLLQDNGWFMNDTIYGITCECELEEI